MKFACLSDIHLLGRKPRARTDDILSVQWDKLNFVLNYTADPDRDFCAILQAGDIFDSPRNWDICETFFNISLIPDRPDIFAARGQHDTYMRSTNPSVFSLAKMLGFIHNKTKPFECYDSMIHICNYGEEVPDPTNGSLRNILIIHSEISDREPNSAMDYQSAKIFLRQHKFDTILCGDIHMKFVVREGSRVIMNTGPMLRKEATEYNMQHKPCFFVLNPDNSIDEVEIPHRPGHEVLSNNELKEAKLTESIMDEFMEILSETKTDAVDAEGIITTLSAETDLPVRNKVRSLVLNAKGRIGG